MFVYSALTIGFLGATLHLFNIFIKKIYNILYNKYINNINV